MTTIDIVIIVFAAFFGLVGFARGFLIGALSLVGFAGGAYLGTRFGPGLLEEGNASPYAPLFGLLGALVGGVLLSAGAESIAGAMRSGIRSPVFGVFDGLLGAALAVALALGLAWLVSVIVLQTPGVREYRGTIQRSAILKELNTILPSDRVLKALARFDPFPSITGPAIDVEPPRGSVARDPDIERAGRSIVRVLSNSCGLGVAGSGWVAAQGIVVTNAHVIAGSDKTTSSATAPTIGSTRPRSTSTRATTSPSCACAGWSVPRWSSRARSSAPSPAPCSASRSTGPTRIVPARVGATASVLANNAYGTRRMRREVTSFRADVQPGNSGGPIVDVAGRVSGTVFSKLVGSAGGYAVPNAIVRDALAGAREPVGTGRCVR